MFNFEQSTNVASGSMDHFPKGVCPMRTEVFRLTKAFLVAKFGTDERGSLFRLPAGAEVGLLGASSIPGCVEIVYKEDRFNIFEEDLRGHSFCRPVTPGSGSFEWKTVARRASPGLRESLIASTSSRNVSNFEQTQHQEPAIMS